MAWNAADAPISISTLKENGLTDIPNYGQIAIDGSGNVYVAGSTNPVNKYNSSDTQSLLTRKNIN